MKKGWDKEVNKIGDSLKRSVGTSVRVGSRSSGKTSLEVLDTLMELFNRRTVLFLRSCHMGVGGGAARSRRGRGVGSSETNQDRVAPVGGSMRAVTVLEVLAGRSRGGGAAASFQELLSVLEFFLAVSTVKDRVMDSRGVGLGVGMGVGVCAGYWSWRGRGDSGWVVCRGVVVGNDEAGGGFFGSGGEGQ